MSASNPRMLIIEDEFLSRNLLANYLRDFGHCDVAVDGEEAIAALRESWAARKPYELVFLDLRLPLKDGQTVLRELRALEDSLEVPTAEACKVIMVSALSEDEHQTDTVTYRVAAFIPKPYTRSRIEKEVRRLGFTAIC